MGNDGTEVAEDRGEWFASALLISNAALALPSGFWLLLWFLTIYDLLFRWTPAVVIVGGIAIHVLCVGAFGLYVFRGNRGIRLGLIVLATLALFSLVSCGVFIDDS